MYLQFHGNITNKNSEGTNELIKQGAKYITCMQDILEEFQKQKEIYVKYLKLRILYIIINILKQMLILNIKK